MILLLGLGLVETLLLSTFAWVGSVPLPLPRLLLPAAALLCWAGAGLAAAKLQEPAGFGTTAAIWGIGIVMRIALIPVVPELSDDIYRYLWDGHVLAQGVNPYLYPPDHEALAGLRTAWHGLINHPEVHTLYPPLAELVFAFVAVLGGTIVRAKLVWCAFDLGCAFLLWRLAGSSGRNRSAVLIWYLWAPLLVVETAWSGHFDAVGLFLMAALLWSASGPGPERDGRATGPVLGGILALAALVKLAPAAALPPLVRRHGLRAGLAFLAVCLLFYLPFAAIGLGPLTRGLRTYSRHWSANEGAFALLQRLVGDPVHARMLAGSVVLAVVAYVTWKGFGLERALLWIIGAGLLLSPTLHPWYALWVLPMAALRRNVPFLLLNGLVFVGYWGLAAYQATGVWPQPAWSRALLWLPVWLSLLWGLRGLSGLRDPGPPKGSQPEG